MTIAIAWTRRILDVEELVFVSDSRLSGDARFFDAAPKILALPRGDCAIAFAGHIQDAFPMMLQLSLSINSHAPTRRRSLDVSQLKTHVVNVFNSMKRMITSDYHVKGNAPDEGPAAEFLFGGYSWIKKHFELWAIRYDESQKTYVAESALWTYFSPGGKKVRMRMIRKPKRTHLLGQIAFAGDQAAIAQKQLLERLTSDFSAGLIGDKIDMQPFETVRDMLRDSHRSHTIGGAPQLVKVYQYAQAISFPIYWPNKRSGRRFLLGRPCMGYEHLDTKIVDPDKPALSRSELDAIRAAAAGTDERDSG